MNFSIPSISRGGISGTGSAFNNRVSRAQVEQAHHTNSSFIFNDSFKAYYSAIKNHFISFITTYLVNDDLRNEELIRAETSIDGTRVGGYYFRVIECIIKNCKTLSENVARKSNTTNIATINISILDLENYNNGILYDWIIKYTPETLNIFDEGLIIAVKNKAEQLQLSTNDLNIFSIRCSFVDPKNIVPLRSLEPNQIETLVATKGICIRSSNVIPEMQIAVFKCHGKASRNFMYVNCDNELSCEVLKGFVDEPQYCDKCQTRKSFVLDHNKCVYTSKQLTKIQEINDAIPEGETPQTIYAFVYDDLVDSFRPGDQITIIGIYRALPVRRTITKRRINSVFRTSIDVLNIHNDSNPFFNNNIEEDDEFDQILKEQMNNELIDYRNIAAVSKRFSPSFIMQAEEFTSQVNVQDRLVELFAPNIWEMKDIKKGLLCQLFGGVTDYSQDGLNRIRSRGEIHILLCGDPSTGKSQLLQYVHKLANRGVYTVGRGTSAAGLTASVVRDSETHEYILESGAVVLSDQGICCIDEFDKLDDSSRTVLHEVMEQQTISFAKSGIVCSLNSRVAILASANPIKSKYDAKKSVVENINMPPNLLSRFDLLYLVLDIKNPIHDRKLATHITSLYTDPKYKNSATNSNKSVYDEVFLAKYIAYAKFICKPQLRDDCESVLIQNYLQFRGHDGSKAIIGSPRQLNSIIRIATALAKMELSGYINPHHIHEATRLLKVATYTALTDPITGKIDFDQLLVGTTEAARQRQQHLESLLFELLSKHSAGLLKNEIQDELTRIFFETTNTTIQLREVQRVIELADSTGLIGKLASQKYILLKNNIK